jgi:PadR family transcriptional regulator PadR
VIGPRVPLCGSRGSILIPAFASTGSRIGSGSLRGPDFTGNGIDEYPPHSNQIVPVADILFQGILLTISMVKRLPGFMLLQGTLDMLVLRTLLFGPAHGHQIARHIQRTTEDVLQVEHGSLYPALHRLERKGYVTARWEAAGKDLKREFKYYELTAEGRKQLAAEESKWEELSRAVARVMWPAQGE